MKNLVYLSRRCLLLGLLGSGRMVWSQGNAAASVAPTGMMNAGTLQSTPTTFDGVHQGFLRLSGAGNAGGTVVIPSTYPFDAERQALPTIIGGHIIDYRGGGELHTFGDTVPPGSYQGVVSMGINCGTHMMPLFDRASGGNGPLETNCAAINQTITTSGMNLGNAPLSGDGKPAPAGWLTTHGLIMTVNSSAAGITAGVDMFLNKFGIGDVHNYWYVLGEGGFRGASDEMLQGRALHAGELSGPTYTGQVTASSAFKLTTQPMSGKGTQGVGRMLIDISAPVASGCITGQRRMQDAGGKALNVSLFALGCGAAALPATTAWGTLATAADAVPYIPSTGSNTLTTPTALTVQLSAGAFQAGDLAVFAGDYHETAVVLSAAAPVSGVQAVTFALRHTHSPGSVVMQSSFGAGGLELLANDGDGQRYVLDVLGAVSPTEIAAVVFQGAGSTIVNTYNMNLTQFGTADALNNTGGTVTIQFYPSEMENFAALQQYPLVTISNASNPAFNGPCLNLHRVSAGYPTFAQCTQTASTGLISRGTATVTLGDTGYGNSRFVLYPLAQVLDVQDYSSFPPTLSGSFRLEPNALPLHVGDTVEEPHDYAAGYVASAVGFGFSNVYAAQFSSIEDPGVGGAGINGLVYARYTKYVNPCGMYAGCGGLLSAPRGYQIGGMAQDFGGMDRAPWPTGQSFTHAGCDPRTGDCSDPFYHYAVFRGAGYQSKDLVLDWNPFSGVYDLGAPHVTISQAPLATGTMLYVCARPDTKEIVYKATACDLP